MIAARGAGGFATEEGAHRAQIRLMGQNGPIVRGSEGGRTDLHTQLSGVLRVFMEKLLMRWCGVDGINYDFRGGNEIRRTLVPTRPSPLHFCLLQISLLVRQRKLWQIS